MKHLWINATNMYSQISAQRTNHRITVTQVFSLTIKYFKLSRLSCWFSSCCSALNLLSSNRCTCPATAPAIARTGLSAARAEAAKSQHSAAGSPGARPQLSWLEKIELNRRVPCVSEDSERTKLENIKLHISWGKTNFAIAKLVLW